MKKILVSFLLIVLILNFSCLTNATYVPLPDFPDDLSAIICPVDVKGDVQNDIRLDLWVSECTEKGSETSVNFETSDFFNEYDGVIIDSIIPKMEPELKELILSNADENEFIAAFDLRSDNIDNPYPEIEQTLGDLSVTSIPGSSTHTLLGKNYRLYYLDESTLTPVEIYNEDLMCVDFYVDKLGTYVLYYDPAVYEIVFYREKSEEYYRINNLKKRDEIVMPPIPEKEGHIFTGWVYEHMQGSYHMTDYAEPQPIMPYKYNNLVALWCPEEEYTPLEITLSSESPIVKGKENGAVVTLTLSEGKFIDKLPEDLVYYWNIVGNGDLSVHSVERVDDKTVKLTLSGNSKDKLTDTDIKIEFNYNLYDCYYTDDETRQIYPASDVKLDKDGVMCERFSSDNAITLLKQVPVKGDANGNGTIDISDVISIIKYIGTTSSENDSYATILPGGEEAAKLTDDDDININDVVLLIEYIGTLATNEMLDPVKFPNGAFPSIIE